MIPAGGSVPVFYTNSTRRELEVWVDACSHDPQWGASLVFSETLCHPHGGGQKGDRGWLDLPPEEAAALGGIEALRIKDTRRRDQHILHVLENEVPTVALEEFLAGSKPFRLRLDWEFRQKQMRLHSTAHLLHCMIERVLEQELAFPATSDLQEDFGLNRYDRKDLLSEEQAQNVCAELNALTAANHPIRTYPDADKPGFRYWECNGWVIPCGGTHPAHTGEIGAITLKLNLKRGRTSLTFRLAE